ncbi:petrobactin biosynthesis protein AsbD [Metabacillus litoralis]|uniref:petrobactin biosynthesis protein AsbD n=1 Tax=Metabacillus litoralis TaxID=152268 RepID=UPI001CFF3DDA|nr:petrobactin biosynthesis protein AsbD [Metabacillus litoralis]
MNRLEIIEVIYNILKNQIELNTISSFHEEARLNEDLYMDSVIILELILYLELNLGIEVPDEALIPKDFRTIGSLADFLERQQKLALVEESND